VPVVATDVGEARAIAGDQGRVVPPGDPAALAAAIGELLALDLPARREMGEAGRTRMARDYGLEAIAERYQETYDAVLE
jgi:glycosyltransferase involved in cell wall biosynthesis